MHRIILLFTTVLVGGLLAPEGVSGQDQRPLWMRYPAISPDGTTLAFGYGGDLYTVPSGGGEATRLTAYAGHDFAPVWSPDGRWLAFASDRFGNFDVWLMPAAGGRARRLTVHSAADIPETFTADGRSVVFRSSRVEDVRSAQFPRFDELYRIPVEGGRPERIQTTPAQDVSLDRGGTRMLFEGVPAGENEWRKHHTSSAARDIWMRDLESGAFTRLTTDRHEDRDPRWAPDDGSFYFLSERGGTFNVWSAPLSDPAGAVQVSTFETHPVRFLSVARNGTLAYQWDGELYTQAAGQAPARVPVTIRADAQERDAQVVPFTHGAEEMAVSPSGKEVAFVYRGEIFVTSVESSVTKRITDTPGSERSISFAPDGKSILYAAERDGSWNLYRTRLARDDERYFFNATVLDEEGVLVSGVEAQQPAFSPDGKEVAYLENRETLRVLNLESGRSRTIVPDEMMYSYLDGDQSYAWSPDGKWFLVQYLLPGYYTPEVGLIAADGEGEMVNLTESGYPDSEPAWMAKGSMMLWFSAREGLRSAAGSGGTEVDAYGLFFTQEAYDRFRLDEEEFKLLKEAEDSATAKGGSGDRESGAGADSATATPLTIELDGIRDRKARLTIHSARIADAVVTPDAETLVYLARFERGYDLWKTNLRTRETSILVKLGSGGGSLALDKAGSSVFLLTGGGLSKIDIGSGKRETIAFAGEMVVDHAAERAYFFEHVWRQVREKFLDPELHGAPWRELKTAYARYLPHVTNNYDLAELLSELLGELNASHTGARYRPAPGDGDDATAELGLLFREGPQTTGLAVAEVVKGGPLDVADSRVEAGAVLEAIDDVALVPSLNHFALLNRKTGANVRLRFRDPGSGETWEEVTQPISAGEFSQLLYERWAEGRARLVDELSNGRIGYVHVRSMSDPSYRTVIEEVLGKHVGKEAIVIDTRNNGGGDLVDDLATFFSGPRYMDFVAPNGQLVGSESQRRWTKPSIMVTNASNYSDAHCTPWAYQYLGIGKIVGTPVAGTCSFVWWEGLRDGLLFGIPNMAVTAGEGGRPLENLQLEPDILVEDLPADVAAGRDAQLEAAVAELLRQLDGGG